MYVPIHSFHFDDVDKGSSEVKEVFVRTDGEPCVRHEIICVNKVLRTLKRETERYSTGYLSFLRFV